MTLLLTLTVTYDPSGVSEATLRDLLHQVVWDAMNNGTVTGETPATVEDYTETIARVDKEVV